MHVGVQLAGVQKVIVRVAHEIHADHVEAVDSVRVVPMSLLLRNTVMLVVEN